MASKGVTLFPFEFKCAGEPTRWSGASRWGVYQMYDPSRIQPPHAEQDPGGPPQRPQVGGVDADFPFSPATAKTLIARAVFAAPQCGHFALLSPLIVRSNCSKRFSQDLHVYS